MERRPELKLVAEVCETRSIEEAAEMMAQGGWVMIAAAKGAEEWLFSMGKLDISRLAM